MQVLHVLSFVVERVGTAVRPHAPALVQYLPLLWEDAVEYNMLRAAILSTLVVLVQVRHQRTMGQKRKKNTDKKAI